MTRSRSAAIIKRSIDVVVAATVLLLVLPILVVALVLTTISLRTWPLFTQVRVGRKGKPFRMVKIRTLPRSAPRYAAKTELGSLDIPTFSRTLRALHLDELPQLLLVLTGRMTLVGPRPEMPQLFERFDPDFADLRNSVRPGCTGLWQISDRCDGLIHEHPEFDDYYLRNQSLALDLWIMRRTVALLVSTRSAALVHYDDLPKPAVTDLRAEPVMAAGDVAAAAVRVETVEA